MTVSRGRLLGSVLLLALAAACGSSEPDTRVLGEQVAADEPAPGTPRQPAETSTAPPTAPPTTSPAPPPPAAGPRDLRLALTLDAASVPVGEDVRGTLTAENPTTQEIDATHPSACEIEQELRQGGAAVSEGFVCATVVTPDVIAAGEVRTWAVRIPTAGMAAGSYEAVAGLNLAQDVFAPPVTVTLTPA